MELYLVLLFMATLVLIGILIAGSIVAHRNRVRRPHRMNHHPATAMRTRGIQVPEPMIQSPEIVAPVVIEEPIEEEDRGLVWRLPNPGDGDACHIDSDCASGSVCSRSRLMYLDQGVDDIHKISLATQQLSRLDIDVLDQHNLNIDDVLEFTHHGENYLLLSTNTAHVALHSPHVSQLLKTNINATDLALSDGRVYALSNGSVYYIKLANLFRKEQLLVFQPFTTIKGSITSIESSRTGDVISMTGPNGTYTIEFGRVSKHTTSTDARIYGRTRDEFAVRRSDGMHVYPNDKHVDANTGVITGENRFFHINSEKNRWLKRMRSLANEPVMITQSMCMSTELPASFAVV